MEVADRIAQLQAEKAELSRLQAERSQLQAELLQVCTQQKELILTSMGKLAKVDSSDHDAPETASDAALGSEAEEFADEHNAPSDKVVLAGLAKLLIK